MARPKKSVKEEVLEAIEESTEVPAVNRNAELQAKLDYLYDLRATLVNEGIDSIGKLDTLIGKVIQEKDSL